MDEHSVFPLGKEKTAKEFSKIVDRWLENTLQYLKPLTTDEIKNISAIKTIIEINNLKMVDGKFKQAVWDCIDNPINFRKQDFNEIQSSFVNLLTTILRKKIIETKKEIKLEIRDDLITIRTLMDENPTKAKQLTTNLIKELK